MRKRKQLLKTCMDYRLIQSKVKNHPHCMSKIIKIAKSLVYQCIGYKNVASKEIKLYRCEFSHEIMNIGE